MRITDPTAMRALAHPLRLDLIEVLAMHGPSTAARCGRRLGVSQANCSFHLRQLAKYGFVEEAPAGPDKRERAWRLTDVEQGWESGPLSDQLDRVFIQREAEKMLDWTGRRDAEPVEWQETAFITGVSVPVTPAELDEIRQRLSDLLMPYAQRLGDPEAVTEGSRYVRIMVAGTPARDDTPDGPTTPPPDPHAADPPA